MSGARHHVQNVASKGGDLRCDPASEAYFLFSAGYGYEDVAYRLFERADQQAVEEAKRLIKAGMTAENALGAR